MISKNNFNSLDSFNYLAINKEVKFNSVSTFNLIYWSVRLSDRRAEDGVQGVIKASYEYHFIRVHENLVQQPRIIYQFVMVIDRTPHVMLSP